MTAKDTQNVAELPTSHDCTTSTTMEDSSPKPFCLKELYDLTELYFSEG